MNLQDAADHGDFDRVQLLLRQGVEKNEVDRNGGTALFNAAKMGHLSIVECLVEQGVDKDKASNVSRTPLSTASAIGHVQVVRYLLEGGADKDKDDHYGFTPLHYAAVCGHLEIAMLLLSYGANLNARTNDWQLPIDMTDNEEMRQVFRDEPKRRMDQGVLQSVNTIVDAIFSLNQGLSITNIDPPNIQFSMLEKWTENFSEDRKVGSGGFGDVFRGEYADSAHHQYGRVAVKRVNQDLFVGVGSVFESAQDGAMAAMRREINVLRAFKHPNIIKLLGFHMPTGNHPDFKHMCLVYEMASNGGLNEWLQDDAKAMRLNWRQRIKIALGIATAIDFLHSREVDTPAYHRDVKSANIGLTVDFCPKLLDCGLAKFIPAGAQVNTVFTKTGAIFGTPGYMCPQYCNSRIYDAKSEIYSFGIVLVELYGGKLQHQDGVSFDKEALTDEEVEYKSDPRIADASKGEFLRQWKELSVNCIEHYRRRISTMSEIVHALRHLLTAHGEVGGEAAAVMEEEMNALRCELDDIKSAADHQKVIAATEAERLALRRQKEENKARQAQIEQELREQVLRDEIDRLHTERTCGICWVHPKVGLPITHSLN